LEFEVTSQVIEDNFPSPCPPLFLLFPPSIPFSLLFLCLPLLLLSLPLKLGPLKFSQGVCGSAVSSLSGVLGGAPTEIEFGAYSLKIWHLVATIVNIV